MNTAIATTDNRPAWVQRLSPLPVTPKAGPAWLQRAAAGNLPVKIDQAGR